MVETVNEFVDRVSCGRSMECTVYASKYDREQIINAIDVWSYKKVRQYIEYLRENEVVV